MKSKSFPKKRIQFRLRKTKPFKVRLNYIVQLRHIKD